MPKQYFLGQAPKIIEKCDPFVVAFGKGLWQGRKQVEVGKQTK